MENKDCMEKTQHWPHVTNLVTFPWASEKDLGTIFCEAQRKETKQLLLFIGLPA